MKFPRNPFEILQITPGCSYETAHNQYRKLVKKHHPDKEGDQNKFIEIQDAWNSLKSSDVFILDPNRPPFENKLPLAVLVYTSKSNHYNRYFTCKDTKSNGWIAYTQVGDNYEICEDDAYIGFYQIEKSDRILVDGLNYSIKVVEDGQHCIMVGDRVESICKDLWILKPNEI